MKIKKIYFAILISLFAFICIPVFAQNSLKIAVIDTDKVVKESVWGKKAIAELEKETMKWQEKGDAIDKKLAELEEKLTKQRTFLDNKEEEQKILKEIEGKQIEGQNLVQQGNLRLTQMRQELLEPIAEEMKNLIKKIAMEESYDLILEKQIEFYKLVLYANPELDITNRVIVMLDKAHKDRVSSDKTKVSEKEPEKKDTQ